LIHFDFARARGAALAAACAVVLSACQYETSVLGPGLEPKALQPLSPQMTRLIEEKQMGQRTPILVRIFKEEAELEVWKQKLDGDYELLKTYPICRWSGELGPKIREGDRQAPEGFYAITPGLMNPRSSFYLAFNLGYPNAFDRALGRTGAHLMVHGDCSSRGCYSMTDEQISEIFALAREAFEGGQQSFQVQAYPFRMTPENLAKHRNSPHLAFWRMLKEGNDHFLVTRQEPKVDVCGKRYVFNAVPFDPTKPLDPKRACPPLDQAFNVAQAVSEKTEADNREYAQFASRGIATVPVFTGRDGGMHQVFSAQLEKKRGVTEDGIYVAYTPPAPGTIPATVRPPRADEEPTVPVITASTTTVTAPAPVATASTTTSPLDQAKSGIFAFTSRWFGSNETKNPAPAPAVVPTPKPRPQQATVTTVPRPQLTTLATPPRRPQPAPVEHTAKEKDKDKVTAPAPLPGATPILATDGFSSFR
jgi:murein L,D-transpeptidase YafK